MYEEEIVDYDPYILNDLNMSSYLKYKLTNEYNRVGVVSSKEHCIKKEFYVKKESYKSSLFIPKEPDTLFWCYYIIAFGETSYEMMNVKNFLVAKQMKINYVSKIRTNKQLIKLHKFDSIANIENNLAHDNCINIKSIMTLCAIDKINVIFIKRNTYYELLANDSEPIYIIREIEDNSKYSKKYGFEIANLSLIEEIRSNLYKVITLDNPLKALSSYKLQELIDICNKLTISIKNTNTGKNKTKNELYELLIQYF
jgi:hypothetical protein